MSRLCNESRMWQKLGQGDTLVAGAQSGLARPGFHKHEHDGVDEEKLIRLRGTMSVTVPLAVIWVIP